MKSSDSNVQDYGSKNILEEFYELIEKHRSGANSDFALGSFYDDLSHFDLAYQEFNSNCSEIIARLVFDQLEEALYPFLIVFKFRGFSDRSIFYAFRQFIRYYTLLLSQVSEVKIAFFFEKNISENFPSLQRGRFIDWITKEDFNFNLLSPDNYDSYSELLLEAERNISRDFGFSSFFQKTPEEDSKEHKKYLVFRQDFEVLEFFFDVEKNDFKKVGSHFETVLDFSISVENNDAQRLSTIILELITSVSGISGNKVEFESLSKGSLVARIKVWMRDLVAKEETKAVLETAKEGVAKALTAGLDISLQTVPVVSVKLCHPYRFKLCQCYRFNLCHS